MRQFLAELVFDSFAQNSLAEDRSGQSAVGATGGRQMLYQDAGYDIDLRLEQTDERSETLIGQILPTQNTGTNLAGITLYLLQQNQTIATSNTNERGVFKLPQIAFGKYELKIVVPKGEILFPQLTTTKLA